MSTEFVTAPKSGVLVSLASHYLLKGYRICVTFDAIRQHSHADYSLGNAVDRDILLKDIQLRSRRKLRMSTEAQGIIDSLENRVAEVELPDWPPSASKEIKESLRTRLTDFLRHLKKVASSKAETPKPAQ